MSYHLKGDLCVAYSPVQDRKWCPSGMKPRTWYSVVAYENGTIDTKEKKDSEAVFLHFIGIGHRPCRLIMSSAVIALRSEVDTEEKRKALWESIEQSLANTKKPDNDPGS